MTSFLLPLHFTNLDGLEKRQLDFIQESVKVASAHTGKLIIAIECEELQRVKVMDSVWEKVQAFLGNVYVAQLIACYKLDDPLFECNVVFQDVCGYKVHLEPYMTHVFETERVEAWNKERKEKGLDALKVVALNDTKDDKHGGLIERSGPIEPRTFQRVAVGGTFDHIHAGHKILLTMTALLAEDSMVVGVTDDCMLTKKKHKELIVPTAQRCKNVENYLLNIKRHLKYHIVPITDPFGPTVTDPTIDALVVSKETLKGGDLVNSERDMRGYPPLELRIIDVISSEKSSLQGKDMDALKISSSWIREYIANKNKAQ